MLVLGPMPDAVRETVRRLVEAARLNESDCDSPFLGYLLHGGPGGGDYLDENGEVWSCSAWDDAVEHVPDGPRKVAGIAIAAEREPELAAWLPPRPASAKDCPQCKATGTWQPPLPPILCPECNGMGWIQP